MIVDRCLKGMLFSAPPPGIPHQKVLGPETEFYYVHMCLRTEDCVTKSNLHEAQCEGEKLELETVSLTSTYIRPNVRERGSSSGPVRVSTMRNLQ
jgi:hypothetical protein